MRKQTRTISGVTPVAVMTRPGGCPGNCAYCPDYQDTPRSYTPESPAVIRANSQEFDIKKQVEVRIKMLKDMGHPSDKIELIIMGGTFLATPADYQYYVIKACFDALNGVESETLADAQKLNQTSSQRCVGLCLETRPDYCTEKEVKRMLEFGATRVELGVQLIDDDVYKLVNRGHDVAAVANATKLLRRYGIKIYYHWMPGLPGSSIQNDLEKSKLLFDDERFKPDGLKLYPTMVIEHTEIEKWWREGKYKPYSDDEMIHLMADIKAMVPPYVRIPRVLRDIPPKYIVAGLKDSVRDKIHGIMLANGQECKCIRCREYGHREKNGWKAKEPFLSRLDYDASDGKEIFLQFVDENDTLFGLLRLRIENDPPEELINPKKTVAIIRELHVFGSEVPLSEKDPDSPQHKGMGRALVEEAERIAKEEFNLDTIAILSAVGTRPYYMESGFHFSNGFMIKELQ
jgi:elongator complex protein 3